MRPFHDRQDRSLGGPHSAAASVADINGGKMDGFVSQQEHGMVGCAQTFNPACGNGSGTPDVMGYHTGADIPNYWAYAHDFVLQDHMFESVASWSLPSTCTWCPSGRPTARSRATRGAAAARSRTPRTRPTSRAGSATPSRPIRTTRGPT